MPNALANANAVSKVSLLVGSVFTTSTSFMTGTGLKKWSPTNRSARDVAAAMSVIVSELVLDAKIVCSPQIPSSVPNSSFLVSRFSTIASMIRSRSDMSDGSVV